MIYLIGFLLYGLGVITGILLVIVIALNGCGDGREQIEDNKEGGANVEGGGMMDEEDFCYCHYDYEDEEHDCLDYMECEECPYYYADLDQESD